MAKRWLIFAVFLGYGMTGADRGRLAPPTGPSKVAAGVFDALTFRSGGSVELTPVHCGPAAEFTTADGQPLSDHPAIRVRFTCRLARENVAAEPAACSEGDAVSAAAAAFRGSPEPDEPCCPTRSP